MSPLSCVNRALEREWRQSVFFLEHGHKLKDRMELGSNEAIKQAIVGRLGIAVLSRHTLALDAPMGQLEILDVEGFPIERHWYFAYPSGKQLSIVAQTFLEYLRQASDYLDDLSCRHAISGHCPLLKNV